MNRIPKGPAAEAHPSELLTQADPEAFALFRNGAELHVWRNSSPHNWWLAEPGDTGLELYHFEERTKPGAAFFAFSRKVATSSERVSYGGWVRGGDEGFPVSETWVFDESAYQAQCERWASSTGGEHPDTSADRR